MFDCPHFARRTRSSACCRVAAVAHGTIDDIAAGEPVSRSADARCMVLAVLGRMKQRALRMRACFRRAYARTAESRRSSSRRSDVTQLWRDVKPMVHLPTNSTVLQRRCGYRHVFRHLHSPAARDPTPPDLPPTMCVTCSSPRTSPRSMSSGATSASSTYSRSCWRAGVRHDRGPRWTSRRESSTSSR